MVVSRPPIHYKIGPPDAPLRTGGFESRAPQPPPVRTVVSRRPPMSLHWDFSTVADHLGEAVRVAEDELRLEQAVYGLDVRDERSIQTLLAGRMAARYEV